MDNSEVFTYMEGKTAKIYAKWVNNPKIRRFIFNRLPSTIEDIKKWFEPPKEGLRDNIAFEIGIKLIKNQ